MSEKNEGPPSHSLTAGPRSWILIHTLLRCGYHISNVHSHASRLGAKSCGIAYRSRPNVPKGPWGTAKAEVAGCSRHHLTVALGTNPAKSGAQGGRASSAAGDDPRGPVTGHAGRSYPPTGRDESGRIDVQSCQPMIGQGRYVAGVV